MGEGGTGIVYPVVETDPWVKGEQELYTLEWRLPHGWRRNRNCIPWSGDWPMGEGGTGNPGDRTTHEWRKGVCTVVHLTLSGQPRNITLAPTFTSWRMLRKIIEHIIRLWPIRYGLKPRVCWKVLGHEPVVCVYWPGSVVCRTVRHVVTWTGGVDGQHGLHGSRWAAWWPGGAAWSSALED